MRVPHGHPSNGFCPALRNRNRPPYASRVPGPFRVALALLFASSLIAADLALVGGTVYVSPGAAPVGNGVIVVHDGVISAVGPRGSVPVPPGARVLDCAGKFIFAGFWNSHVHILTPALLHARDASAADLDRELDGMLNRWGFTTVFDVASVLANTVALRDRIERGDVRGPHILTTGEPLWTEPPVYVRDFLNANHIRMGVVTTPGEAAVRVREEAGGGADGIKLFTGSAQERHVANMPLEIARAAVTEAHRLRLPVFAHPQNLQGLQVAIESGVDILAHTAPESPPWTPEFVATLKGARMALIPTLTLFDFEARKAGAPGAERQAWIDKMVRELRAFSGGGGEVLFGTDVGYIDHFDTALEFTLMSHGGMSFEQILAALTTNPAGRFGRGDRSGRIAKGLDADLTVLQGDPAQDVTAFSRVRFTIRSGVVTFSAP